MRKRDQTKLQALLPDCLSSPVSNMWHSHNHRDIVGGFEFLSSALVLLWGQSPWRGSGLFVLVT